MFKRGDVIAYVDSSLKSKVIEFLTRGVISHVALVIDSTHIIEALPSGVRCRKIGKESINGQVAIHLSINDKSYQQIQRSKYQFDCCVNFYNGQRYGFLSALKAWLDIYLPRIRFHDTKKVCCSA